MNKVVGTQGGFLETTLIVTFVVFKLLFFLGRGKYQITCRFIPLLSSIAISFLIFS